MKCRVCGAESGKYPLCKECNQNRQGDDIKMSKLKFYANMSCADTDENNNENFLYELKSSLVTKTEMEFLECIKSVLPENCLVQAQANLASFITRTDNARFQNELYRNVDFIITDLSYRPLLVVEINDKTHQMKERQERDKKVANICEEAGIPVIKFWTSYGVNREYIKDRITKELSSLPKERVHHFQQEKEEETAAPPVNTTPTQTSSKNGCYIATCVYGSYDCPQVWVLRRFRDNRLRKSWIGCIFINVYYAVSPSLVKIFGNKKSFKLFWRKCLDAMILHLKEEGVEDTPYTDF